MVEVEHSPKGETRFEPADAWSEFYVLVWSKLICSEGDKVFARCAKIRTLFAWQASLSIFERRMRTCSCCNATTKIENDTFAINKRTLFECPFIYGRGDKIRTCDFYVPNVALYQAEPHLDIHPNIISQKKFLVKQFYLCFLLKKQKTEKIPSFVGLFVWFSYQTSSGPEFPAPSYASRRAYEFS